MKLNQLSRFPSKYSSVILPILLAVFLVAGTVLIIFTTRLGAGLSDDSYYYIKPVRDFMTGNGMILDPAFPPLVNLILLIPAMVGIDPQDSLRYINAGLFGASIFLAGILLKRSSKILILPLFCAFFLLISSVLIEVYSWALSEPIYLFLSLLSFYLIDKFIQNPTYRWLMLASLISALAFLTRYAGITVIVAGFTALYAFAGGEKTRRIKIALIYAAISVLPAVFYGIYNYATTQTVLGSRVADLRYLLETDRLIHALNNMLTWFLPGRVVKGNEIYLSVALLVLVLAVFVFYWLKHKDRLKQSARQYLCSPISILSLAWAVSNLLLLYFGQGLVFGKGDAFNNRYLSPVLLSTIMLLFSLTATLWGISGKFLRALTLITWVFLIGISLVKAKQTITQLNQEGAGYASGRWHISETIAYLNNHPDVPVISTGGVGIYFWTGRTPEWIKPPAETHAWLHSTGGYLVIIDSMPPELYGIDEGELIDGLTMLYRFSEGSIYQYPGFE